MEIDIKRKLDDGEIMRLSIYKDNIGMMSDETQKDFRTDKWVLALAAALGVEASLNPDLDYEGALNDLIHGFKVGYETGDDDSEAELVQTLVDSNKGEILSQKHHRKGTIKTKFNEEDYK